MKIEDMLKICVSKKASDLHVSPGIKPLMRIDGTLVAIPEAAILSPEESKSLILDLLTEDQKQLFEKVRVTEMALHMEGLGSFRVSIFHQLRGVGAVFRVIPPHVPSFDELAIPTAVKGLLNLPHGLILVTGPTGSGKSTTLAAMVDYINSHRICNIITIEDPVEFVHTNKKSIFNQLQVGRDTPNFSTALRASLRQDPNVILIGELRDLETMRLALTAAETGHLVLATLHACSAPLAINRFADVFPTEEKNRARTLLSETLQAVICQTLLKKVAGGRVAAFEIMLATTPIRHFIRQDMPAHMESTIQMSSGIGMCTLEQYIQDMVKRGMINSTVAEGVITSRTAFKEAGSDVGK